MKVNDSVFVIPRQEIKNIANNITKILIGGVNKPYSIQTAPDQSIIALMINVEPSSILRIPFGDDNWSYDGNILDIHYKEIKIYYNQE